MPDVLIYADTFRSPELRHEVPLGVPDPFLYVEKDGVKHISIGSMEIPRLAALGLFELHPNEEYGLDELIAEGKSYAEIKREIPLRAVDGARRHEGRRPGVVPALARRRAARQRRRADRRRRVLRRPAPREDGVAARGHAPRPARRRGRDGRGARPACAAPSRTAPASSLDGEPLTVERVKDAMAQTFAAHGCTADDFIVAPGPQGAVGHDMGSGPISAGVPIVIDIWPRDNESFVFCDMTRTFVVGEVPDAGREWHRLCKEALDRAVSEIKAGADGQVDLRRHVRDLRGGGRADPAHEEAGRAALGRVLPRARPRRRARGARGAGHGARVEGDARGRRRRHRRAGPLPPGLRRRAARGPRPRHRGRRENLTDYPYDLEP